MLNNLSYIKNIIIHISLNHTGGSEASHYARPDANAQVGAYAPSDNVNVGGYSGTYQALDYVQPAAYNDLQTLHGQNQFGQPQFGTCEYFVVRFAFF